MNSDRLSIARSLLEQRRFKAATRKLKKRTSLSEELLYSELLVMQNKSQIALNHLKSLLRLYPQASTVILKKQPTILQALGHVEAANELSCQLARENTNDILGYLSHLQNGFDPVIELNASLENTLKSNYEDPYVKGVAAYCLFNVKKDDSKYDYLHEGAKLIRSTIQYHHDANIQNIRSIANYFPVKTNDQDQITQYRSPIFIVGMPRSGTTLLEQMLGSHSKTLAVGESVNMGRIFAKHGLDSKGKINLSETDFAKARTEYLTLTYGEDSNKRTIVDKMPNNFIYVGFILSLFPNAKVIYSGRDPIDNCFSIYRAVFQKNRHKYSYNQTELADYQISCKYLMDMWIRKYPNNILNVKYECLVKDTEKELRKLVGFCELGWEEVCLDFHKNKNVVHTLSAHQVKKPVHSSSVGAGIRLLPYLSELAERLGVEANKTGIVRQT